ncbi:diguanylate cyclase [Marinobacter sp.]|uniref:sensor domain-containing diguanylate cyclase n=1 Tax=Marinobacter sp. TaxID=50741 RepID=UPI0035657DD0
MMSKPDHEGAVPGVSTLLPELASGVPGILFCYQLSADGTRHHYPFISRRVGELFDLDPGELEVDASAVFAIIHPDDQAGVLPSIRTSAARLEPWQYQARLRLKDGTYHWFEAHSVPRREADGSTLWYGQFIDIQSHKELEAELREREAESAYQLQFHKLLASLSSDFINSPIGDIDQEIDRFLARIGEFFDVDRVYIYRFSERMTRMTNTHEWCRAGVPALKDSQQNVDITEFRWWQEQSLNLLQHNRVVFIEDVSKLPGSAALEKALLEKQGVAAMFCIPIVTRGSVEGFFGMDSLTRRRWRRDLSDLLILVANLLAQAMERFRLEEELLSQSIRDPLTGIHNRRYLEPRIAEMLARHQRSGEGFALAMLDIDHFKQVNDTHGHLAGDQVLRIFARLLQRQCRATDVAARYGGEEFILVLADVTPERASWALERVIDEVRELAVSFHGKAIPVTASAGLVHVSGLAGDSPTPDDLITEADRRLYRAKRSGRNCLIDASGTSPL